MFVCVLISIEISFQLVEFRENCISKKLLGKWRRASSVHGERYRRLREGTENMGLYPHARKQGQQKPSILCRLGRVSYCRKVLSAFLRTKMDNHSIKGGNILMKNAFDYNKIISIRGQIPLWIWNDTLISTMGVSNLCSLMLKMMFKISYELTYTLGLKFFSYSVVTFCHNTHQAL